MKKILLAISAFFIYAITFAQECPTIAVEPNSDLVPAEDTLVFTVVNKFLKTDVTYNWTISAGVIISGQGTARIFVNPQEASGMTITATVEIGGLPPKCNRVASYTVDVIPGAQLVVSGTFRSGQELKNAVQKFIAASGLKTPDNTGTAFVYLYKTANTSASTMKSYKDALLGAFEYNKLLPNQYKIADGGTKKLLFYEIYLMGPGAKEPKPNL